MSGSDRVLGGHLDLAAVARDARAGSERRFRELASNDGDLSAGDRIERVERLAQVPGIQLALACEDDQAERYLVIASAGYARIVTLADSRAPDRFEAPEARIRPVVEVAGDVVATIRRLQAGGAIDPIYDLGNATLRLPFEWRSREELVRALVDLAPVLGQPALIAEIGARRFEVSLQPRRLRCVPLYIVAPDHGAGFGAACHEIARIAPPAREDRVELVFTPRPLAWASGTPLRDPSRPYTTGTLAQRRAAVATTRDPTALMSALRDPANAQPPFDQVRRDIYQVLAPHDSRDVAGVLLWALHEETESVIDAVTSVAGRQPALRAVLPDLAEAAEIRGDRRTAVRMRAAIDEAGV